MDFFIPFPFPNFGNGIFNSLPVPKLWEWNFLFPFPFPNPQKSFPLTPGEYESIFANLEFTESEGIFQNTGCRTPCKYKKYSFLGEPYPSAFESDHYIFLLWAVSYKTRVETEELIYPSSSLVAEFGGTLGLFLGFSFLSLWDNFSVLRRFCFNNF